MIRGIATLMRGTLLAQLLGLLVLPVLTRLYAPQAFGALQLFQSILGILLVVATMRYEYALLHADSAAEMRDLLRICLGINLIMAAVLAVGLAITARLWPASGLAGLPFPLWLLPLAFIVSGTFQYLTYWITREHAFGQSANGKLFQSSGTALTALGLGQAGGGAAGLVAADIAGRVVALAYLSRWMRREWASLSHIGHGGSWRATMRKYREFPVISVPGGLVNVLGGVLTPIMIYATFSVVTAGQYGLVDRSLTLPLALVVVSVSQVYAAELARRLRSRDADVRQMFHTYLKWLSMAGFLPAAIVTLFGAPLFVLVFGSQWAVAGKFAQILAPAFFFMLLAGSTNMTIMLLGKQKVQMAWEVGRLFAMALLWLTARRLAWPAEQVLVGHAAMTILFSLIFLVAADILLRHANNAAAVEDVRAADVASALDVGGLL